MYERGCKIAFTSRTLGRLASHVGRLARPAFLPSTNTSPFAVTMASDEPYGQHCSSDFNEPAPELPGMSMSPNSRSYAEAILSILSPQLSSMGLNDDDCMSDDFYPMSYRVQPMSNEQLLSLQQIKATYYHPDTKLSDEVASRGGDVVTIWSLARVLGLEASAIDTSVDEITRYWLEDSSITFFFKQVLPVYDKMVR